jgi:Ca-activated chloride channel homolog
MSILRMHLGGPAWLMALWAAPAAALLLAWAWRSRWLAARLFAGPGAEKPTGPARIWAFARGALVAAAIALLALALARPQWNPKEQEVTVRGRDVVFLVDVSRSMLSQDVSPSRLERAKLWINDVAGSLKGDRVGLVAFAGAAVIKCPLTLDYGFFRMALDELSPASVPRGGTLIGDALRKTLAEVFDSTEGRGRDIILITDGEDHDSFPVQAAEQAGKQGVRIIAIGIGSESGSLVPTAAGRAEVVTFDGERVRSKMEAGTLAQIASASPGGVFFNVGTGNIDLEQVYRDLIASAAKSDLGTKKTVQYEEKFQLFLGAAVGLLMLEGLLRGR